MKVNRFDKNFWDQKYRKNKTGWDIGHISTPIKNYIDQLENKNMKILIPGAGNSYEAEYLWNNGFKNLFVLDISEQPLKNLKNRVSEIPDSNLIRHDFFEFNDTFDLIIEQTFFCALDPDLRSNYAKKMFDLLNDNGKLVGLLFNFELTTEGPPFGGTKEEYLKYFTPLFEIDTLERAHNSIKPRMNRELFFIFEKKSSK
ncbi:MAG: SAM-dependent methyltransferase [Flavobacteriaceae bacterium]|nr:SAM-dependent methyltransferase [Bacteroidia bacterium]NNL15571.1 SAM-dependent methyltransferase [Flavobacteriaceae bacterium]